MALTGNKNGMVLIFILWVIVILGVVAGEFCHSMRNEVRTAGFLKDETKAYYIAYSGIHKALFYLFNTKKKTDTDNDPEAKPDIQWRVNVEIPPQPIGDGMFNVWIGNESGKVNLNYAERDLLKLLVIHFGVEDLDANVIADSILDWRDKDSLHRLDGAENNYYKSLPEPYSCKDGDFTSVNELLFVRGITRELFFGGLNELVSVSILDKKSNQKYGKRELININAASPELLSIFPTMTPEAIEKIIQYRQVSDISGWSKLIDTVGPEVADGMKKYIDYRNNRFYTMDSTGWTQEHSTTQKIRIMVEDLPRTSKTKGYKITQWIDSTPDY